MRERKHMLPVWFFVGILLFLYGIIILITSLEEWPHPPAVMLSNLHPGVWAGIMLLIIGGFYSVHFRPRRK